ncbi:hypothetical protein lerEdw1_013405 [Lerista edwardsae]|nr:hypothetical protein lerEdw1_013406 [Lerista edwardsae]KAJ6650312.1 hypothetical protein lerEdw1_013405 [Lerista edwardsae]
MTDVNPSTPSSLDANHEYYKISKYTQDSNYCTDPGLFSQTNLGVFIMSILTFLICIFGVVVNGVVIWLLRSHINRNPFPIYIKNLSLADLGLLITVAASKIFWIVEKCRPFSSCKLLLELFEDLFLFLYTTGQFLLTIISIDRCVSVFFPIWYRCHRPRRLTTAVSILTWIVSFALPGAQFSFTVDHYQEGFSNLNYSLVNIQRIVNALVCLPLMAISTLILLIKFSLKSQQPRRGKLLKAILLALLFFFLFAFPMNIIYYNTIFTLNRYPHLIEFGFLCTCLNSSINPVFYFLVGRKGSNQTKGNVKAILEGVFKEEEEGADELELSGETQL